MRYIAHRGLFRGPDPETENTPGQLIAALNQDFECEVDVWFLDGAWYLGHNSPTIETSWEFLNNAKFWLHCKNLDAYHELNEKQWLSIVKPVFFWHETDQVVRCSNGMTWTYLGRPETLSQFSICVMPEVEWDWISIHSITNCAGFCSDWIERIRANRT